MLTGRHTVRDVFCTVCSEKLGWCYEYANEESQRYKEGKVILEKLMIKDIMGCDENKPYYTDGTIPTSSDRNNFRGNGRRGGRRGGPGGRGLRRSDPASSLRSSALMSEDDDDDDDDVDDFDANEDDTESDEDTMHTTTLPSSSAPSVQSPIRLRHSSGNLLTAMPTGFSIPALGRGSITLAPSLINQIRSNPNFINTQITNASLRNTTIPTSANSRATPRTVSADTHVASTSTTNLMDQAISFSESDLERYSNFVRASQTTSAAQTTAATITQNTQTAPAQVQTQTADTAQERALRQANTIAGIIQQAIFEQQQQQARIAHENPGTGSERATTPQQISLPEGTTNELVNLFLRHEEEQERRQTRTGTALASTEAEREGLAEQEQNLLNALRRARSRSHHTSHPHPPNQTRDNVRNRDQTQEPDL